MIRKLLFTFTSILIFIHSEARVRFQSVNIHSPSQYSSGVQLDFNGDGQWDFGLDMSGSSIPVMGMPPVYACGTTNAVGRDGYDDHIGYIVQQGCGFYTSPYRPLPSGALIGSSLTFNTSPTILRQTGGKETGQYDFTNNCYINNPYPLPTFHPTGLWNEDYFAGGYLGIMFKINGATHYGYIKFDARSGHMPGELNLGYTISELAYEDIPGYPITTGDRSGYIPPLPAGTYNRINGKVYNDKNNNCTFDTGDLVINNTSICASSGSEKYYAYTDSLGNYSLDVLGGSKTFQLQIFHDSLPGQIFTIKCAPTNVSFSGTGNIVSGKDFGIAITPCPILSVNMQSTRRRCFKNITNVSYKNNGSLSATNVQIKIIYPKYIIPLSSTPTWTQKKSDTLIYQLGTLNELASSSISITDSVVCGDENIRGLTQCSKAIISASNLCSPVAPNWDHSDLRVSANCNGNQTLAIINNNGTGDMSDSAYYRIFFDNVIVDQLKYKLHAKDSLKLFLNNQGKAVRVEADYTPGHPIKNSEFVYIEGCGIGAFSISKGVINNLPVTTQDKKEFVSCGIIRDSFDPNEKSVTPAGFGSENKTLTNQEMHYTVNFQNTGNDVAYTILVVDTLASELDFSTFRVEAASHKYRLEVSGKNNPVLKFIFGAIKLPDSTTNKTGSHGFISFKINQKKDLSVGTIIKNKAYIYFDYNSAIITNETSNEIFNGYMRKPIIVFNDLSKTYGDDPFALNLTSSGSGAVSYTMVQGNSANVSSNGNVSIQNSGTVLIKADIDEQGLYAKWSDTMTLTVNKATITVTADDQTKNEGEVNPVLTYSFSGFKNNDDQSVLSGSPAITTDVNNSTTKGTYPITIQSGSLSADNYDFVFVNGSMEVARITGSLNAIESNQIKVFPNPSADGNLFIETEDIVERIVLINSLGQSEVYYTKQFQSTFKGLIDVKVFTNKGLAQYKIVVQ